MRTIIITALLPFSLLAQFKIGQIRIIPTTDGTAVGQIEFDTTRADGKAVVLKAPNVATAGYTLTLPIAAPATNGECLTGTTAGVLSFGACDGLWTLSGSDIYRATGRVTVGSSTADSTLSVVTAINSGLTVSDGTTRGIMFPSSVATNSLVVGTTTNHPVVLFTNNTEALKLEVGGTLRTRSHILTNAASASDIGDATNYFQTVFAENGDFAPPGVANSYLRSRKLEIFDIGGTGTAFWDQRANATSVTSSWTLRDNAGSRALQAVRQEVSSPANYIRAFGELRPALRATASGDAVDDSTLPALGNTSERWSSVWGDAATITNALTAGSVTAGTITATTAFSAGLDNVTPIGSSSVRLSKVWTYDLSATGTIQLKSSSTSGHVWTATDSSGNGGWAAGSCAGCLLLTGGTINGGINAGVTVTDGTATGILFASSLATNSIVAGTTSAHPFILFGHNGERARATASGFEVTGTLTARSHILTDGASDADIGDATNYFQTVYAENGDFTAGSVANQYLKTRKLEIADIAGSGGFWDHRSQGSYVSNSSYTIRDNGGSRWLSALRAASGSPLNSTLVFTAWVPALRATADGDATNDATLPALGSTGSRWSKTWTADLDAAGTVKLGTSSTVGQVWTASDTAGNGGWSTPGSSQWITSGSNIYYTLGGVGIGTTTPDTRLTVNGGTNSGVSVTDGTARGIMFASSISTNSVVVGTTSSHPLIIFGHNGERARATSTGFDITGAATVSSYLSVGSTDNLAQLYARASDVNGLRIHNSGTPSSGGGAGIQAAIESAPSTGHRLAFYSFGLRTGGVAYNGASITAFATQNWTPGSAQGTELRFETTANGAASRTASVVVTAGALTLAGNLLFSSDNAYTVGTSSAQPSILYGRVVNSPKVEIRDTSLGSGFWDQRVNASGSASDWHLRDNSGSRAIRFGRFSQNVMTVYGTLLPGKRDTVAGDATTDSVFGDLGQSGVRWAKVWGDDGDFLNGVVAFGSTGFILDRSSRTASTSQVNFRVASSDANAGNWKILARPASPATQSEFAITSNGTTVFSMVEGGSGSFASDMGFGGSLSATQVSATSNGFRIGGTTVIDNSRNLTNIVSFNSTVSSTELGYLDGVTSSIQTQIDGKLASSGGTVTGSLSPSPSATYNLGSNSARWLGIHGGTIVAYSVLEAKGTVYAPDGNSGISATVTVRNAAGTGSCTLVFSGGLLTGGTC
jgi:hypothetical protein